MKSSPDSATPNLTVRIYSCRRSHWRFYALTHSLTKASLFLIAGNLSSRSFQVLRQNPIPKSMWIVAAIASRTMSGFPLLAGFSSKILTFKELGYWQAIIMNISALETAIAFAKFFFLPWQKQPELVEQPKMKSGFWLAII